MSSDPTPVVMLFLAMPLVAWLLSPIAKELRWWFVQREMRKQREHTNKVFARQRAQRMREVVGER